jgi:transposase InsO family protein
MIQDLVSAQAQAQKPSVSQWCRVIGISRSGWCAAEVARVGCWAPHSTPVDAHQRSARALAAQVPAHLRQPPWLCRRRQHTGAPVQAGQTQPGMGERHHLCAHAQWLALSGRAVLDLLERFLLNLKVERVWQRDYANYAEDKAHIADYILGFYNPVRLHSTLGYQSPSNYELRMALAAH